MLVFGFLGFMTLVFLGLVICFLAFSRGEVGGREGWFGGSACMPNQNTE